MPTGAAMAVGAAGADIPDSDTEAGADTEAMAAGVDIPDTDMEVGADFG